MFDLFMALLDTLVAICMILITWILSLCVIFMAAAFLMEPTKDNLFTFCLLAVLAALSYLITRLLTKYL